MHVQGSPQTGGRVAPLTTSGSYIRMMLPLRLLVEFERRCDSSGSTSELLFRRAVTEWERLVSWLALTCWEVSAMGSISVLGGSP